MHSCKNHSSAVYLDYKIDSRGVHTITSKVGSTCSPVICSNSALLQQAYPQFGSLKSAADASACGIDAVLSYVFANGYKRLIAYALWTLSKVKQNNDLFLSKVFYCTKISSLIKWRMAYWDHWDELYVEGRYLVLGVFVVVP